MRTLTADEEEFVGPSNKGRSIRVAILLSENAYLPEAEAYRIHFESHGFESFLIKQDDYVPELFDVVLLFHGFHPLWKKYSPIVIGEYHSMSVGRMRKIKDFLKRELNVRSDLTIFLNRDVWASLGKSSKGRFVFRPMGYFPTPEKRAIAREFDFIYVGSDREGLDRLVANIQKWGATVLMVGKFDRIEGQGVTKTGYVPPRKIGDYISLAEFGLNYVPRKMPYIVQDSTKLIEYCAMGLKIVSMQYPWVMEFESARSASFYYLRPSTTLQEIREFAYITPDVSDLQWDRILDNVRLAPTVSEIFIERQLARE